MAKKAIISTETLNAIGQAIIEKGGATSPMYPKDMPTAIRSIQGSGEGRIPAGGTKGQVLAKKSNVDFDLEWKTGGDMRHDEFDELKLIDDLNPENTGIMQICSLLNQIKNLLKPVCVATLVSLFTFSGFSAYVETNKLVNLIGKSNVVTGVSLDGLLTGINTNGHPVSVSGGIADIIFPEGGGGITTNAVKDIASSAAVTNAGAVAYSDYEKRGKLDMSVYYLQYGDWTDNVGDTYTFFSKVDNVITWKHGSNDFIEETLGVGAGARWYMMKNGRTARVHWTYSEDALEVWMSNTGGDSWILTRPYYVRRAVKDNDSLATELTAKGIASSAAVTNEGAVARAKAYADGTFMPLDGSNKMTGTLEFVDDDIGIENITYIHFQLGARLYDDEDGFWFQSGTNLSPFTPDNSPVVTSNMLNGVITPAFAQKADLAVPSATGNFAALNAQGNLTDSGKKAADFAPSVERGYLSNKNGSLIIESKNGSITFTNEYNTTSMIEIGSGICNPADINEIEITDGAIDLTGDSFIYVPQKLVIRNNSYPSILIPDGTKIATHGAITSAYSIVTHPASEFAPAVEGGYLPKSGGEITTNPLTISVDNGNSSNADLILNAAGSPGSFGFNSYGMGYCWGGYAPERTIDQTTFVYWPHFSSDESKNWFMTKSIGDSRYATKDDLKPLSGKSFGLATQQEMAIAISNIIEKLGGTVTSMP